MTESIREVSAPGSTAEPQHQMSETGAARLAALAPEQLVAVDDKPAGETAPAEDAQETTDGQAQRTTPPSPITSIAPIEGISERYQGIADDYRADLAAIADENHSIPPGELSTLFQFIGGRAAANMDRDSHDATYSLGQQPGPNLANPDETRHRLSTAFGTMADAVMNAAKAEYDKLPVKVKAWIDQDMGNGQRLGNHPDVVLGLALRPYARLTVEAATKELETIRQSAAYQTGEKLAVAKSSMLQLVVARGNPPKSAPQQPNRGIVFKSGGSEPSNPSQGTAAAKALRAELNALSKSLTDPKGELSSNTKNRKAAIARRQEINGQLEGGR